MNIEVNKLPKLGFGMMRLPEQDGAVDMDRVRQMVDTYMESGFNYFDTAYVYHSGKSESVVKEALVDRYPRDSFYLATKLPQWEMTCKEDRDRIFQEQLERAGVEYFDFYLLHSLEEGANYEGYVNYDCFQWGKQKKSEGKIRHFGFSFHGTPDLLELVLSEHPEIEFVQIQLNYADWENPLVQSGALYEILRSYHMPIIVMEPVKGGNLANMPAQIEAIMKHADPDASAASWAMRFAGSLEGVMTILSGMSTEAQMEDNLKTFQEFKPLTQQEHDVIYEVVNAMRSLPMVPCTSCRYCCDGCPSGIRIPEVIKALNAHRLNERDSRASSFYEGLVEKSGKASDCIACGQCEGVCPQHLSIIELLQEASGVFDTGNNGKQD